MTQEEIIQQINEVNETRFKEMNGRSIISASKMIEFISKPFDKEGTAKRCAEKGATDPNYKYAGMTAEQIIAQWEAKADESKHYGRLLDEYSEQKFCGSDNTMALWKMENNFDYDDRLRANCLGLDQFWNDLTPYQYQFVGREITVYVETPQGNVVTGRIDWLGQSQVNNKLFIVDWKTTDEIKTKSFGGQTMMGPAFVYDDCDVSKYSIQVQTYKNALVNTYGLAEDTDVVCAIVNLQKGPVQPSNKNYIIYTEKVPYSSKTLNAIVDFAVQKRKLLKAIEAEQHQA